jgi:hypothetical protein
MATGVGHWAQFIRDHLFAKEMEVLADVAAGRVRQLRDEFPDPCAAAHRLGARETRRGEDSLWHAYHTGAAHALCGDPAGARRAFERIDFHDQRPGRRCKDHNRMPPVCR